MKRLLCVLMLLSLMALLIPTASGNTKHYVTKKVNPTEAETAGCRILGTPSIDDMNHVNWDLTAQAATGWKFVGWSVSGVVIDNIPQTNTWSWNESKYISEDVEVTATFALETSAAPEPEPVVVDIVEDAKPEEPHVHAEEWVEGTPATCTHTGLTDGSKCKWCGEVMQSQKEIPKIDHVYSMWVPNGSGKHYANCLNNCGYQIDADCQMIELPFKSTSGAAITLCPVCGDCNGAAATAVKGLKIGEGAPYRGTLRVWNIDAGDNNKYLAVSFDRFGKVMQPEGEVSITLPDDMKGATAGVIGADGSMTPAQESNGTLKLDFTGYQVVVLKGN